MEVARLNQPVYVSGLYSGPNPSPGVGTARSLRLAYPDAELIGVDYSNRSLGLHWPDFDRIWLQRPWEEIDLDVYRRQIVGLLESGAIWLSGLDLETVWLAGNVAPHTNLLVPPLEALGQTAKPSELVAAALSLNVPTFIRCSESEWALHRFCRTHDWRIWLKGPFYEARAVTSWQGLLRAQAELSTTWSTLEGLFIQQHIDGYEESIALCCYHGRLLQGVHMIKREVTPEGKTWAGKIMEIPNELLGPLQHLVAQLEWTGGAEIEMLRDIEGKRWIMEWNPRFPAWIHGASLCGNNMPARLIENLTSIPPAPVSSQGKCFARVVVEIPVKPDFPLPTLPEQSTRFLASSKHPSGMPTLAKRMGDNKPKDGIEEGMPETDETILSDLNEAPSVDHTPSRVILAQTATRAFKNAKQLSDSMSTERTELHIAYSVKTNPHNQLLELARGNGFRAEVISQLELRRAMAAGFSPDNIVLNGPGKWWPDPHPSPRFQAVFCDTIEELDRLIAVDNESVAEVLGIRIRMPGMISRFGVDVTDFSRFQALVQALASVRSDQTIGLHFHMASSDIGVERWWSLYGSVVRWCQSIESVCHRSIGCLDLGGGWFPDDWDTFFIPQMDEALSVASRSLRDLRTVIIEPGKALAQPSMALITRVIDYRQSSNEVVVDGSVAELPMAAIYPHRTFCLSHGQWMPLGRGDGRILGRLCMESDVLSTDVSVPGSILPGDLIAFCDAGAYDESMSYEFGRG